MIVCVCKRIRCGDVDEAVRQGCRSVTELARRTGAGTDCGSCALTLRERVKGQAMRQSVDVPLAAK